MYAFCLERELALAVVHLPCAVLENAVVARLRFLLRGLFVHNTRLISAWLRIFT